MGGGLQVKGGDTEQRPPSLLQLEQPLRGRDGLGGLQRSSSSVQLSLHKHIGGKTEGQLLSYSSQGLLLETSRESLGRCMPARDDVQLEQLVQLRCGKMEPSWLHDGTWQPAALYDKQADVQ